MIIKFYEPENRAFRFIDHCEDVTVEPIDEKELLERYDGLYPDKSGYDPANESPADAGVLLANKVFWLASRAEHAVSAIESCNIGHTTIRRIGYTREGTQCAIVSNMALYLMNDDGKTIERIN